MNANKYQGVSDELSYLLIEATDDVAYQAYILFLSQEDGACRRGAALRVLVELSNIQRIIQRIRLECAKQFST